MAAISALPAARACCAPGPAPRRAVEAGKGGPALPADQARFSAAATYQVPQAQPAQPVQAQGIIPGWVSIAAFAGLWGIWGFPAALLGAVGVWAVNKLAKGL